ncbi:histidine phosphatase family protein [Streptomyces sp. MK5]|uniref:histidine phosphatase family protein n=1 Tax=Streptomyces sp. MK5 TaxID=3064253 RepID=UPI003556675C
MPTSDRRRVAADEWQRTRAVRPAVTPDQTACTATGELILTRHGRTGWRLPGRHAGRTDVPLTEAGEAPAKALAPRPAGAPLDTHCCWAAETRSRCRCPAQPIASNDEGRTARPSTHGPPGPRSPGTASARSENAPRYSPWQSRAFCIRV